MADEAKDGKAGKENAWGIDLEYPVTLLGTKYERLEFRRPKARDMKKMTVSKKSDVDKSLAMLADLSLDGLSPDNFEELDAADFLALQTELGKILGVDSTA